MTKQIVNLAGLQKSPYFSHAVKAGALIYLSGIAGIDPATNQLSGSTIEEQTRQSLENCRSILEAANAKLDDVVDVQVLLANPADFGGMNSVYTKYFHTNPPARSVAKLGVEVPGLLVSIRMTAAA